MSQLAGGRADKFGNIYERQWVVCLALDVIEGHSSSLKWEPLGPEGAGVDCETRSTDGTVRKYQCKANNGTDGAWSVADLADVLSAAKVHLDAHAGTRFVFVSADSVPVLRSLAERARTCDNNAKDFLAYCLSSEAHKRDYPRLCGYWGLQPFDEKDAQRAIALLQRMEFRHAPNIDDLYRFAQRIAEGEGEHIVALLGHHLEKNFGNTLRSDQLRGALHTLGHPALNLGGDQRVPDSIERLQANFRGTLEPHLIGSALIVRSEATKLAGRLRAEGAARLVFVTGEAGSGKSGVLLEALQRLGADGVPYLPIRLDTHYPDRSVLAFSKDCLGLPATPATCLNVQADGRRAVLVIDQLDAVRWTSANSDAAWERCKEIIEEALQVPNMTVVVAGRSVDLDEDPRIQHWTKGKEDRPGIEMERFNVGPLSEHTVTTVVALFGLDYASLPPREKLLLSNAQNLQLWWRLANDGRALRFSSRAELLRSFWQHYRDKAVQACHVPRSEVDALLERLVSFMDRNGRLDAPSVILDGQDSRAAEALRTLGIIDKSRDRARFAHQSHLDYLTIERVLLRSLDGHTSPIEWLKGHDQSLFRRDQVRFLLQLLRDQDAQLYRTFLEAVFFGDGIRFHIQHLVLTTLAQAAPPTPAEHELVKRLWNTEAWHVHVLERVLAQHEPWLNAFTSDGRIPGMLSSEDAMLRDQGVWLCQRSADAAPSWFERVLTPHWEPGDQEWRKRIERALAHDAEHDTETVFAWRLECARSGADDPEVYTAEHLAEKNNSRALALLAAIVDGLISNVEKAAAGDKQRGVQVESEQFKQLAEACKARPREAWGLLLPVYQRAIAVHDGLVAREFTVNAYNVTDSANHVVVMLHEFLVVAGGALLSTEGIVFLPELKALGQAPATGRARKLVVDVLALAPSVLSDPAVECFLAVDRPLDIETRAESMMRDDQLSAQDPAASALRTLAATCSQELFTQVEGMVLALHTSIERRSIEWRLKLIRGGQWSGHPNLYGLPQYALLLSLPEARLSEDGRRALWLWRSKFGELARYRENGPVEALSVVSPIPADKARVVSDNEWVHIVSGTWTEEGAPWREIRGEAYIEPSPSTFAASLERAGQLNPGRCVKLALRFPLTASDSYYHSLLRVAGLSTRPADVQDASWVPASVHDVEALLAHIAGTETDEIAMAICRCVADRSGEQWSQETRERIRSYALHHAHSDRRTWPDSSEERSPIRAIEMAYLNTVRTSAVRAVAQILWAHPELFDWAREIAEHVVRDPHPAVRATALELAYAIAKHDHDVAVGLFARACDGTDAAVIAVHHGPYLLRVLWRRESELTPVLRRALDSSEAKAIELAAYWATVGNAIDGIYAEVAQGAAAGGVHQRVGVVQALVSLAQHESYRAASLAKLMPFVSDADEKVLDAADTIFRKGGFLATKEAPAFAHEFARSAAFRRDPTSLLHQLEEYEGSLLPFADAIEASVAQLSGALAASTQSMAHHNAMAGRDIATILLRLYQQAEAAADANLRRRCLDQWDALLRARVGMGQDVLTKLDS
jgi:hypothetical protein